MFVNFNILNQLGSPAINSNTFANRPAAGQTGRLFVSTDTFEIYRDNGTSWDLIGGPGSSTITGTGTATQVAYFTSSQAIGSSANLYWDNTNGYLGVATATPGARIEAVKTDGYGIYANYTTNAGSGASTTAIYAVNNTAGSGYAAVIEEKTGNTTGGQYPLLVKHSLSSGTAAVGNGTGLQFQLQDDAGAFKTTQLTIETTDAAAATYKSRYRFNVQNNGSSTPVAYLNATGLGLFTATPGAALDIHSTGVMAQLNSTSATANSLLAFQRSGNGLWRIGDNYNSGSNYFELYNTALSTNAIAVLAATNKTEFTAVQTYTSGLARGNYFDYNLSVAAGGSFSSPNTISAVAASLDLTLAGSATIPSGARSGLDAYNTVSFTGTGTLTHSQGTQIRAYSNLTTGWAFNGSATGTITHLAGLRVLFPDNSGSAVTITNNYGLLINDQTANTGTVTYTNRWGIYQEGASDTNYFAATTLIGTTVNSGYKFDVSGSANATTLYENGVRVATNNSINGTTAYVPKFTSANVIGNSAIYDNSGNIGINNINSVNKLDIVQVGSNNSVAGVGLKIVSDAGNAASLAFSQTARGTATIGMQSSGTAPCNFVIGTDVTGSFLFKKGLTGTYGTDLSTGSTQMILDASGNLGIGTSTPNANLQVTSAANPVLKVADGIGGGTVALGDSTITDNYVGIWRGQANSISGGGFLNIQGSGIAFMPTNNTFGSGTEAMRITSSANVLVGKTSSTGGKLQVSNGTNMFNVDYDANGPYITAVNDANTVYKRMTYDASEHIFAISATEKMRLSGNNLLIGTTTDNGSKLLVIGNAYFSNSTTNIITNDSTDPILDFVRNNNATTPQAAINFKTSQGTTRWQIGSNQAIGSGFEINRGNGVNNAIYIDTSNNTTFGGSIKTAAPTTGTAAAWKLGSAVATSVTLDTTQYIEVDIGGTAYKLAIVTPA